MKIGKVTGNALKRSVLKPITYRREEVLHGAGIGQDCAILAVPKGFVMTSCVQQATVESRLDLALLIGRCVNNLAASGSQPMAAMLGLILPKTVEEPQLKALMADVHEISQSYDMQIAGGHTTVSDGVNKVLLVVTVYGLQPQPTDSAVGSPANGAASGQEIVISKWIGLEGTALLADKYGEGLKGRYPGYLVEEAAQFYKYISVLPEATVAVKSGVSHMHDASEGGILAALWELAEGAGTGLTIDLKKLPIRQETVEVCEFVGANPYELRAGGCLIMTTNDGQKLVEDLEEAGIAATVVGKLTDSKERLILNEDEVRYMDRPQVDEIYRY